MNKEKVEVVLSVMVTSEETLEGEMWELIKKLCNEPYDTISDQLKDAIEAGKLASAITDFRKLRSGLMELR